MVSWKVCPRLLARSVNAVVFISLLLSFGLAGCEYRPSFRGGGPVAAESARSEKQRVASPNVAQGDLAELAAGNSAFAFDLYQAVRKGEGNLFYSPYSISLALAMTYAGARGQTEKQMREALHFTLAQERLHPAFNALDLELSKRGEGAAGFRLDIANSIWGQTGYRFLSPFLDVLAENYGAGLRLLDFQRAAEQCRVTINNWVSEQTQGKVQNLLPEGIIDELTRLVLVNAIYFKAAWSNPFQAELTQDGTFHLLDGKDVSVPMMRQTEYFGYAKGEGYEAVELPYVGGKASMLILLPEVGRFREFESSLDAKKVDTAVRGLAEKNVALTMPKFKFASQLLLKEALIGIGMADAFSSKAADFSGMDGSRNLFIADVAHKAFVAVDEAGTEAAAATAVLMRLTAMPAPLIEVRIDRPFILLIRDIPTNSILFMGRVVNPSA